MTFNALTPEMTLHSPFRPRSEGATESGSGRFALGQSSLCLCVSVVEFLFRVLVVKDQKGL